MSDATEIRASKIVGSTLRPDTIVKVKLYDFKRPDKFSKEQIRTFAIAHELVARELIPVLSTRVGANVRIEVDAVDQLTFEEFMHAVPEHCVFAPLRLHPLRGSALLEADPALADLFLETACGQPIEAAAHSSARTGPYTEAETTVLASVIESMLPSLRTGWSNIIELSPSVISVEGDRRDCMIVPPTEMIILVGLRVSVGKVEGFINLACPFLTIEPIIERLSAIYWYSSVRNGPTSELSPDSSVWDLDVQCELSAPAGTIALAELPGVLSGAPLLLTELVEGGAILTAGGVDVARLRIGLEEMQTEALTLEVIAAPTATGAASRSQAENTVPDPTAALEPRLSEIADGVRDLRASIQELRTEREFDEMSPIAAEIGIPRTLSAETAADLGLLLNEERPSLVAFVLAAFEEQSAARILASISETHRADTVRALTRLVAADRGLHARLTGFLLRRIQSSRENNVTGGPATAASILNHVPMSVEKEVMTKFQSEDAELFESIAQLMFVFEDFVLLDESAIAKLSKRVEPAEFALALKGVAGEVADHIVRGLPDEYVAMVNEADESLGRVRRRDVEAAQREIIEELRRLEEDGEVVVARPDEVVE
jgi:flagellar motor switch protein FliM